MNRLMFFAVVGLLTILPAYAEDQAASPVMTNVEMTVQTQQDKARLEIKWPDPIIYSLMRDGMILRINFDRPFQGNIKEVQNKLKDFVTRVALDHTQTSLLIYIPEQFHHQSSLLDANILAIDIMCNPEDVAAKNLPKTEPTKEQMATTAHREAQPANEPSGAALQSLRVGVHKNFERLVFDWDQRVGYKVKLDGETLIVSFNQPLSLTLQEINQKLPKGFKVTSLTTEGQTSTMKMVIPADRAVKDFYNGTDLVVDFTKQSPKKTNAPNKDQKKTKSKPTAATDQTPTAELPQNGVIGLDVTFPPTAAYAFFQRGKSLWLVLPKTLVLDEKSLIALKQAGFITYTANDKDFQALVLVHNKTWLPQINPQSQKLELWDQASSQKPAVPSAPSSSLLPFSRETETTHSIQFKLSKAEPFLSFKDPVLGDLLWVMVSDKPDYYSNQAKEWSQLRLLPSFRGLAFIPLSDTIKHAWEDTNLTITLQQMPSTPAPSAETQPSDDIPLLNEVKPSMGETTPPSDPIPAEKTTDKSEAPTSVVALESVLMPKLWARGSPQQFVQQRQALQLALTEAPPEEKKARRLDLAQFFLAHGMPDDALGLLRLNEEQGPVTANDAATTPSPIEENPNPIVTLMKAAAFYWSNRPQEALDQLKNPDFDSIAEIWLWRAASYSQLEQWDDAKKAWDQLIQMYPSIFPDQYSTLFQYKLGIPLAEMLLAVGDDDNADKLMTHLEQCAETQIQKDMVTYLSGSLDWLRGESPSAHQKWQSLASSLHPLIRMKAGLAAVEAGLSEDSIKSEDAAQQLEKLRFTWRGDRHEFKLLHRLGTLYINNGNYRTGLATLRTAIVQFPDWATTANIPQQMQQGFINALTKEDTTTPEDPLKRIALFHEFQELMPSGTTGDQIIQHMADEMIGLDLLDQAADLMDDLIDYRLQGQDKIKATLTLSNLYLDNRKPDAALDTLKKIVHDLTADVPKDLDKQLRLVTARTLYELGTYEDALKSLDAIDGTDVILLRAEINWQQENWPAVAQNYATLVATTPLEEKQQSLKEPVDRWVFLWALSLALSGDSQALKKLNDAYGEPMKNTAYADSFAIAIQNGASSPELYLRDLAKNAGAATAFRDYLKNVQERYKEEEIKPTSNKGH